MTRIALCYFGITRSLSFTIGSIRSNVIGPAQAAGESKAYAHLFLQDKVVNPRTGEDHAMDPDEYRLLGADEVLLEPPHTCLKHRGFDEFKRHGDPWEDNFVSMRNLIHQLHSLDKVGRAALRDGVDVAIFCRPDLQYHDSLAKPLASALATARPSVLLPFWQPHGGHNDRFAICVGRQAIETYSQRISQAEAYCETLRRPLHSERLLAYSLQRAGIRVRTFGQTASRVRADGALASECFRHPVLRDIANSVRPAVRLGRQMLPHLQRKPKSAQLEQAD